jgi:hypothetical protein
MDIVIFDNLSELKRVSNSESFLYIEETFQKEKRRYMEKLLNPDTSDQETLNLKAVINALNLLSPKKVADATLMRAAKRNKKRHPELFKS